MQIGKFQSEFPVVLAPMAGVTDLPFRQICRGMGCDLTYTEMVSAKGLHYGGDQTRKLLAMDECPCAIQIFGSDPNIMADIAKHLEDQYGERLLLIDINMGCPAPKITGNGEGSALMKNPTLSARIIETVSKAVRLPVTVKFRKGWDDEHVNALSFAQMAEQSGAAAVTIHGRTRMQMYSGQADWDMIRQIKERLSIPVLGNGDIFCAQDVLRMKEQTNCDGVMVARGAQGNPWIFLEIQCALQGKPYEPPTASERLSMALTHARMQEQFKGPHGIIEMRKHISWYLKGLPKAATLRTKVNTCTTLAAMEELLHDYECEILKTEAFPYNGDQA